MLQIVSNVPDMSVSLYSYYSKFRAHIAVGGLLNYVLDQHFKLAELMNSTVMLILPLYICLEVAL